MTIAALRTPEDRFANLPGFPYPPRYVDDLRGFEGLRAAFVDEGPRDAKHTFLCLHGEPSWSYLYRKMIPIFVRAGGRVVAPDFFGFGRSDKPIEDASYTFHFHRDYLLRLIERLDLRNLTLVVQDWGGVLGLTLPVDAGMRPRIARLIAMNTGIASGVPIGEGFDSWRKYMSVTPDLDVARMMQRSTKILSDAEAAAYGAPFPDRRFKAGVRAFPPMVMTDPGMPGVPESKAALAFWSKQWSGPSFIAHGAADPVFRTQQMEALRGAIRESPPLMVLPEAGHFVQEWGAPVAEAALLAFGGQ
jgi:pimeloyl-ACP methyl ester carboxylesterase